MRPDAEQPVLIRPAFELHVLQGVDADLYRFELELVNDDGAWRIIGATWSRAVGE